MPLYYGSKLYAGSQGAVDNVPVENSKNLITSGAVYKAIEEIPTPDAEVAADEVAITATTAAEVWPNEADRPADPNVDDALLQLSKYSKIAHGSYAGTGYAGPGYENTLTFDFAPMLVIISSADGQINSSSNWDNPCILARGRSIARYELGTSVHKQNVTWGENSVTWVFPNVSQAASSGLYQMNHSQDTYHYIAFG